MNNQPNNIKPSTIQKKHLARANENLNGLIILGQELLDFATESEKKHLYTAIKEADKIFRQNISKIVIQLTTEEYCVINHSIEEIEKKLSDIIQPIYNRQPMPDVDTVKTEFIEMIDGFIQKLPDKIKQTELIEIKKQIILTKTITHTQHADITEKILQTTLN